MEINKKLFAKADSLIDKILFCPRIKLSNAQTLILVGVELWVLLSDFAQQIHQRKPENPDLSFFLTWCCWNTSELDF